MHAYLCAMHYAGIKQSKRDFDPLKRAQQQQEKWLEEQQNRWTLQQQQQQQQQSIGPSGALGIVVQVGMWQKTRACMADSLCMAEILCTA